MRDATFEKFKRPAVKSVDKSPGQYGRRTPTHSDLANKVASAACATVCLPPRSFPTK
jgi:hypothetical protein